MSIPAEGARALPVRPDLDQFRRQAKDLLRAIRPPRPAALAKLASHHPNNPAPKSAKLADVQLTLARSYRVPSWRRLSRPASSSTRSGRTTSIRCSGW